MEIKDKIKELRLSYSLTQSQLADELNKISVSHDDPVIYTQTISYWENGRDPSINALIKISKLFKISVDYILGLEKIDSIIEEWHEEGLEHLRTENLREHFKSLNSKKFKTIIFMLSNYISFFLNDKKINKKNGEGLDVNNLASMFHQHNIGSACMGLIENSVNYKNARNQEESNLYFQEILSDRNYLDNSINQIIKDFTTGITLDIVYDYLDQVHEDIDGSFEDILAESIDNQNL